MQIRSERQTFLHHLRESTKTYHQKLEELPVSKVLLSPGVQVSDYKKYLQLMYGIIVPFEAHYFPRLESIMAGLDNRRKAQHLENDLVSLGMTPEEVKELPLWQPDSTVSAANAIGAFYVIEGSTLGGAVIHKHLQQHLNLPETADGNYLQPYGRETGSYWKAFMDIFCNYCCAEEELGAEAIDGASATFRAIHDWLEGKD